MCSVGDFIITVRVSIFMLMDRENAAGWYIYKESFILFSGKMENEMRSKFTERSNIRPHICYRNHPSYCLFDYAQHKFLWNTKPLIIMHEDSRGFTEYTAQGGSTSCLFSLLSSPPSCHIRVPDNHRLFFFLLKSIFSLLWFDPFISSPSSQVVRRERAGRVWGVAEETFWIHQQPDENWLHHHSAAQGNRTVALY